MPVTFISPVRGPIRRRAPLFEADTARCAGAQDRSPRAEVCQC